MLKVSQILVSGHGVRFALALCGVAILAGCGQKGPLFLPTGDAAVGRATLPQVLAPGRAASAPAADAPAATGTATPAPRP